MNRQNWVISQIPHCTRQISHNAPFLTENVHISVTKWYIVRYGTGTLWDLCNRKIGKLYCISKEEPTKVCLGPFKIHMVRAQVPWLKIVYQDPTCIWPKHWTGQLMCIKLAYHFMAWHLPVSACPATKLVWLCEIFTGPVKFWNNVPACYKPKCLWHSGRSVTARNFLYFTMA